MVQNIIKITKHNFDELTSLVEKVLEKEIEKKFSIRPLNHVHDNFTLALHDSRNISRGKCEIIVDDDVFRLLRKIQDITDEKNERNMLRLLGIICDKAFIGPETYHFDVSSKCPNSCIYCWFHSPLVDGRYDDEWKKQMFDFELFKRLVDECSEMEVDDILLLGRGEPFTHPRFPDMLRYIKRKGMKVTIFTNGLLLDKKIIDEMISIGVEKIHFSVSGGSEKSYMAVHPNQKEGSFTRLMDNIGYFAQRKRELMCKYPTLNILHVINNLNYDEILKMFKFAIKFKLDEIKFQFTQLEEFSGHLKLDKEQIERVREDFEVGKKIAEKTNLNIVNNFEFQVKEINDKTGGWSDDYYTDKEKKRGCYIGWYFSRVWSDGIVSFCCNPKDVDNVKEQSMKNLWFSEKYNKYRVAAKNLSPENNLHFMNGRMLLDEYCDKCPDYEYINKVENWLKELGLVEFM